MFSTICSTLQNCTRTIIHNDCCCEFSDSESKCSRCKRKQHGRALRKRRHKQRHDNCCDVVSTTPASRRSNKRSGRFYAVDESPCNIRQSPANQSSLGRGVGTNSPLSQRALVQLGASPVRGQVVGTYSESFTVGSTPNAVKYRER